MARLGRAQPIKPHYGIPPDYGVGVSTATVELDGAGSLAAAATGGTIFATAELDGVATFAATAFWTAADTSGGAGTIAEDSSAPAAVQQTSTTNATTASFSPPANSLLVALVGGGWGPGTTSTVTDSGSHTWTKIAEAANSADTSNGGLAAVWCTYLTSAPGSITVTAAAHPGAVGGGTQLVVKVLTGAASSQSSATGQTAVSGTTQATTTAEITFSTGTAGSWVYGVSDDPNTTAVTFSPVTGCSTIDFFQDTTDGCNMAAWKASAATGTPGSTLFGGTWSTAQEGAVAAFEVLPGAGVGVKQGIWWPNSFATFTAGATEIPVSSATLNGLGSLVAAATDIPVAGAVLSTAGSATTGTSTASLAITIANVGDAIVVGVSNGPSAGDHLSSISSSKTTGWTKLAGPLAITNLPSTASLELWMGVSTGTGADTLSLSWNTTPSQATVVAQEFTAGGGSGTTWSQDGSGGTLTTASASNIPFPTLTPGQTNRAYIGYSLCAASGQTSGQTSGYTVVLDPSNNPYIYNPQVAQSAQSPTDAASTTGASDTVAALIYAVTPSVTAAPTINLLVTPLVPRLRSFNY